MEMSFSEHGDVAVAKLSGSVDAATAPDVTTRLTDHIDDGSTRLVVDLTELEYTSSAGLRALLAATKQARGAGGDFRLAGPGERVRRVLSLSGFDSIIKTYPDVDAAVESFRR